MREEARSTRLEVPGSRNEERYEVRGAGTGNWQPETRSLPDPVSEAEVKNGCTHHAILHAWNLKHIRGLLRLVVDVGWKRVIDGPYPDANVIVDHKIPKQVQ